MSCMSEYKLQAVWKIKKETFIAAAGKDTIESNGYSTTLPQQASFSFVMEPLDNGLSEISILVPVAVDLKEIQYSIPSANYVSGISSDYGCLVKNEDLLNPEMNYFVDDILTIEITGTLLYKDDETFDLGITLWKSNDKDFTFIVGNDTIKIHKFILDRFSTFFSKILNKNQVIIENFDYKVVETVAFLCYGEMTYFLQGLYRINHLFKVIKFSNIYDMPVIKEQVERELTKFIKEEYVCMLANKSVELKAGKLREYCINFISNCIKDGKSFDGYDTLNKEVAYEVFKNTVCQTQIS